MIACLFDIDGTLLSSGGAGKHAMYAAIASEFGVAEFDDGVAFAGRTDRAIGRDLFERHGVQECEENWQRFVRAYLGHLPHSLASRPGCVLPGVAALLDRLSTQEHVAIGLLTGNIRDGAESKLRHYRIERYFAFGGFGDLHLDRDEVAREAFSRARAHVQSEIAPERVWVIGDTPLDIRCARAIGARVLAVCTGVHCMDDLAADQPDLLVNDLRETSRLAELLSAR